MGVKVTGCQCYLCDIKDRRKFILDQQNGILMKVVGGPALPVQEIKCAVSDSHARSKGALGGPPEALWTKDGQALLHATWKPGHL